MRRGGTGRAGAWERRGLEGGDGGLAIREDVNVSREVQGEDGARDFGFMLALLAPPRRRSTLRPRMRTHPYTRKSLRGALSPPSRPTLDPWTARCESTGRDPSGTASMGRWGSIVSKSPRSTGKSAREMENGGAVVGGDAAAALDDAMERIRGGSVTKRAAALKTEQLRRMCTESPWCSWPWCAARP